MTRRVVSIFVTTALIVGVLAVAPASASDPVGVCPDTGNDQQGWFLDSVDFVDILAFFGIEVTGNTADKNGDGYLCYHVNVDMTGYWTVHDDKDLTCPGNAFELVPIGDLIGGDVGNKNDANGNGYVCANPADDAGLGSGKVKVNVRDNNNPPPA